MGGALGGVGNNGGLPRRWRGADSSPLDAEVPCTLRLGVDARALRADGSSDVDSGSVENLVSCEGLNALDVLEALVVLDALHLDPASSSKYRTAKKSCVRLLVVSSCAGTWTSASRGGVTLRGPCPRMGGHPASLQVCSGSS